MANLYELHPNQQLTAEVGFAAPCGMQVRHVRLLASFVIIVLTPLTLLMVYLFGFAQDRFVSYSGFSVVSEDAGVQLGVLEGLANISGGSKTDASIVHDFLDGPAFAAQLKKHPDIVELLSPSGFDPMFWDQPDGLESIAKRWRRLTSISLDSRTGVVSVTASAFHAEDAQRLNRVMLVAASGMLAGLSKSMREDSAELARSAVEQASERLNIARQRLTGFRISTRIVDPRADLEGRLGLMTTLQAQLNEAKISLNLLRQTSIETDPRLESAKTKVSVIEALLEDEKNLVNQGDAGIAKIAAEFESLMTDVTYAQEYYLTALGALDAANAMAQRKTRYLAVHVQPTLADMAMLPHRWRTMGIAAFFLCLAWLVGVFGFYGARGSA